MKIISSPNLLFLLIQVCLWHSYESKVLELSDRFLDVSKEGMWLVKFYAPWCGHCRKLEPIYSQVSQSLHYSGVRVGRVDCTRFSAVATEYDIHGFPTILFLKGSKTYTYKGDRTRDDLVDFALRLEGPPVKPIKTAEELEVTSKHHKVYFLGVSKEDDSTTVWKTFNELAEKYQPSNYFYSVSEEIFSKATGIKSSSQVFVYKDSKFSPFDEKLYHSDNFPLNVSMSLWIKRERFPAFTKITHGSLPQLLRTEKFIAIAVLEENLIGKITPEMEDFREMLKLVAEDNGELQKDFVFCYVDQPGILSSIAMQRLASPSLFVVNSITYGYYVPTEEPGEMTPDSVVAFLNDVLSDNIPARGGNGFITRVYRVYYDATSTLVEMWSGNPVLTTVLFGLPMGFLSLICYSICCADILDANDDDETNEDDVSHEKKE